MTEVERQTSNSPTGRSSSLWSRKSTVLSRIGQVEKSISLLVQDNLKSPHLPLLQSREIRGKENERMETVYSGQHTLSALKETRVKGKHDPQKRRESKGKGEGFRNCPTLHEGLPQNEGTPKGKSPSRKGMQPTCFAFMKGDCPGRNACDDWHPPECSVLSKTSCELGNKCAFSNIRKGLETSERREIILW